jgi:cytochrome c-type biogenesis protein CcmF
MIPEVGHFMRRLALAVAIVLESVHLLGAHRGRVGLILLTRPCTYVMAVAVLLAFACLLASLVRHDFSVLYVASNSNTALPLQYRIAGVWGGHEGSLYGNSTA